MSDTEKKYGFFSAKHFQYLKRLQKIQRNSNNNLPILSIYNDVNGKQVTVTVVRNTPDLPTEFDDYVCVGEVTNWIRNTDEVINMNWTEASKDMNWAEIFKDIQEYKTLV